MSEIVDASSRVTSGNFYCSSACFQPGTLRIHRRNSHRSIQRRGQAAQIQTDSDAAANATDAKVINDVPNVTQPLFFYAMLQNGVQPRSETSTSTLGDL